MSKKANTIRTFITVFWLGLTTAGCTSWLDLQPTDAVTEEKLFSSKEGFFQALNGVYLDLNQNSLYGGTLLCSDIEIMAQRYSISSENANYTDLADYKYKTNYPKTVFQNTWNNAYTLILTINKILQRTEEKKEMLGDAYDMIRGELYGLRAFLHFDLLRVFGPVMAEEPNAKSIPYATSAEVKIQELLPASDIITKAIFDLNRAEAALANDPIISEGPLFSSSGNDDSQRFRTLRLNYYAVKALEARIYLYGMAADQNYREKAFNAALKVISENEAKRWFKFVSMADLQANSPDRIFSTEVLFMNQNNKRIDIHKSYFDPSIKKQNILAPEGEAVGRLYNATDYRYKPLWLTSSEKSFPCLYKYASVDNSRINDLIPLIRLSEMYLIAAETAPTSQEGITGYLNNLLVNRGINVVGPDSDLDEVLEQEYRREFFGEGQLFFYYKRKNTGILPDGNKIMSKSTYVVPLPESEIMYR